MEREQTAQWQSDTVVSTQELLQTVSVAEFTPRQDFATDLHAIKKLQAEFDAPLGNEPEDGEVIRSYNPVLARWKYEQLETPSEKKFFRAYEQFQMETHLRERYHAATSAIRYQIDEEGKLRNELFPDEAFDAVLERGVEYRKANGSPELDREEMEMKGFKKMQAKLTDPLTPIGSKFVVISSPGMVEGTTYVDNYVDIYEVEENKHTQQRSITMTRFASDTDAPGYEAIAKRFDPDYFVNEQGPRDGWYLLNGIYVDPNHDPRTTDELFDEEFSHREDAISEADFQHIYQTCLPFILNYLQDLCDEKLNPEAIAVAYNAVLRKGDVEKKIMTRLKNNTMLNGWDIPKRPIYYDIRAEANRIGREEIEKVIAGCGRSDGISLGMRAASQRIHPNSVAKYAFGEDQHGGLQFRCPDCNYKNTRKFGTLRTECENPNCQSKAVAC